MSYFMELPLELTIKIADHLDCAEDVKNFGHICSWWRKAMKQSGRYAALRNAPWLMQLAATSPTKLRAGWMYDGRTIRHVELPGLAAEETDTWRMKRHLGSSLGWIVCIDDFAGHKVITLVHSFTGEAIRVPDLPKKVLMREICGSSMCCDKEYYDTATVALSRCPTTGYYTLVVAFCKVCSEVQDVCFWNSRNKEWVVIMDPPYCVSDIIFYKSHFYLMDGFDNLIVATEFGTVMRVVSLLNTAWGLSDRVKGRVHLVESGGKLLLVVHYYNYSFSSETGINESCSSFRVFEVDVDTGQTKEVRHLANNNTLFVSLNSSSCFSVDASPYMCKPNCIYFVNESKGKEGVVSVFDLTSGKVIEDWLNLSVLGDDWKRSFWVEPLSIDTTPSLLSNSAIYKYEDNNLKWDSVNFFLSYASIISTFYNIYSLAKSKVSHLLKK